MATATTTAAVVAKVLVLLASSILLLAPRASAAARRLHQQQQCDAMRDVVVTQDAGHRQSDEAKRFTVEVANRGGGAVSGIHLMCGYSFRAVHPVDPDVVVEVGHGDCLLIGGGTLAPGGNVSFGYISYVRYEMTLLAATCDGAGSYGTRGR